MKCDELRETHRINKISNDLHIASVKAAEQDR